MYNPDKCHVSHAQVPCLEGHPHKLFFPFVMNKELVVLCDGKIIYSQCVYIIYCPCFSSVENHLPTCVAPVSSK